MGMRAITLDTPMDVVMDEHPEVISVLLNSRMHCVGCLLSSFHSISDAAFEHEMDPEELLALFRSAISSARPG